MPTRIDPLEYIKSTERLVYKVNGGSLITTIKGMKNLIFVSDGMMQTLQRLLDNMSNSKELQKQVFNGWLHVVDDMLRYPQDERSVRYISNSVQDEYADKSPGYPYESVKEQEKKDEDDDQWQIVRSWKKHVQRTRRWHYPIYYVPPAEVATGTVRFVVYMDDRNVLAWYADLDDAVDDRHRLNVLMS